MRARPVVQADVDAVAELFAAHDRAVLGEPDTSVDDVADDWRRPRFDPARDACVVHDGDGRLAGYAAVWPRRAHVDLDVELCVHPDVAAPPVLGRLLAFVDARAVHHRRRAPGGVAVRLAAAVDDGDEALAVALTRRGYRPHRWFRRMELQLDPPPAPARWPGGVAVAAFRPGVDDAALHDTLQEALADHYRSVPEPRHEWLQRRLGHPQFDPALVLLAWQDGLPVAALLGYDLRDLGLVREVGVRPEWRGRGLAEALLREEFTRLRARAQRRVVLYVDSDNASGATRLYERVGMRVRHGYASYVCDLTPTG